MGAALGQRGRKVIIFAPCPKSPRLVESNALEALVIYVAIIGKKSWQDSQKQPIKNPKAVVFLPLHPTPNG